MTSDGKIKAGIIGGAGYTAGELIRILVNHPAVSLGFVHSTSNAGNKLCSVHSGLIGDTDMVFSDTYDLSSVDVLFLCSGHGKSTAFWAENSRPEGLKVIDLAQDYRDESEGYVYGLPEINRERIAGAMLVANPGCFATCIQLALLPLAAAGKLTAEVNVTAIKIGMNVHKLQGSFDKEINFIPVRGDFARGILASLYTDSDLTAEEATALYRDFYKDAAFTFVSDSNVDLKQVVNTNKAVLSIEKHGTKLLVNSVVDNLLKGASGQAVQNMNLMFGLPEKTGLNLKASAF